MVRVIEEVALDPPGLMEHLLPLDERLDTNLHAARVQHALAGLHRPRRRGDNQLRPLADQDLFARGRDREAVDAVQELVGLARAQVEFLDGVRGRTAEHGRERLRRLEQEHDAFFARDERDVIFRWNGQGQDALADPLEVDDDLFRFFGRFLVFILVLRLAGRRLRGAGLGGFRLLRLLRFLVVALRRERRGQVLLQDGDVDAPGDGPVHAGHVQPPGRQSDVRAGREEEIFPAPVEGGILGVAQPVRDLRGLAVLERIDHDDVHVARELLGVGQPAAVRRPAEIEGEGRVEVGGRVDLDRHTLGDVDVPERQPLVVVGDLLAVGRPDGPVEEGRRRAEPDRLHRALPGLVADVQGVLARFVREVSDRLAVGRPRRGRAP